MQNKKALALALGAALAIPVALAQKGGGAKEVEPDSAVELYGKVYPEIVRQKGKDATPAGTAVATFAAAPTGTSSIITRNEMESSNSRFGVRGQEKLGGELRAIFQLETEFHVDSNDSRFARRDSFVGLRHKGFGTVKLGRMDTPFKEYGDDISFLGVSSGNFTSTSAVLRRFGFGTSTTARFHERRQNAVQYESPQLHGADFKVQYSTDETDGPVRKPHVWSVGGKYDFGNFRIMAGHEIHWDLYGGSNNVPAAMRNTSLTTDPGARSKDKASEIGVTYKLGRHQFELDYEWHEWTESGMRPNAVGRFQSYKNNSWLALWYARWSQQWRTQIHYVRATAGKCTRTLGAACVTDGLEGTQVSAGAAYYFSRRTYLFFMTQWLRNGKSAIFATGTQTPSVGETVTQYAVGLHHSF
jgi:predicted porin